MNYVRTYHFTSEWENSSESYLQALDLWMAYYRDTEAYDVSIGCPPSRFTEGGVIPVTHTQRHLSDRFASKAKKEVYQKGESLGIYVHELDEAMHEACEWHEKELRTKKLTRCFSKVFANKLA